MSIFGDIGSFLGLWDSESVDAQKQALQQMAGVKLPELMRLELDKYVSAGQMTPETAQALLQEASAYEDMTLDPSTRLAQMKALESLQEISDSKGITDADKARLRGIARDEETRSRGAREAISQQAQSRGVGGSGIDLAAQLQNQQGAAQRMSQRGSDVAAQAQERALQALLQSGQLGGQIRGQDWQQEAAKAQARDQIAQFNLANQQAVMNQNIDRQNQAQLYNLQNQQQIANLNTQGRQQGQLYNATIPQQQFQNQLARSGGVAQQYGNLANQYGKQSERDWQTLGGVGNTIAFMSDEDNKKDKEPVNELDIDQFLGDLTGYKYKYKEPEKYGEGEQMGVMAQDMPPDTTIDTSEGKMVDMKQATEFGLAAVSNLHERLKKLEGNNASK